MNPNTLSPSKYLQLVVSQEEEKGLGSCFVDLIVLNDT